MPELQWWDERLSAPTTAAALQKCRAKLKASIDLDDPYVRELVAQAFNRRQQWTASLILEQEGVLLPDSDCSDLYWGEYERVDWEKVHRGEQIASSFCVRKGLIRKAHLAHNLSKWNAKHPHGRLARAVPQTLVMVLDDIDYFEEALSDVYEVRDMADGSEVWIAKPSLTNQAVGVQVFDRVSSLKAALEEHPDLSEWVLQRYIQQPLLVNDRKFHIRAYALCIGSLQCYVFSEMLALFAAASYSSGLNDLNNLDAHLTNTCRLQRSSSSCWQEDRLVKLVSELPEALVAMGYERDTADQRIEDLQQDVRDIVGCCIEAVASELTFFTLPNCFELFGFDLLVDENWNVWLLEANAEPDLRQTGKRLRGVIDDLIEGVLQLVADPFAEEKMGTLAESARETQSAWVGMGSRHWIKVLDKQLHTFGPSGIRMM